MMKTNVPSEAPVISSKGDGRWVYPRPGTSIHRAWQYAWDHLLLAEDDHLDGPELALEVAEECARLGRPVHRDTIKNMLNSARVAGILEVAYRKVDVPGRGPRTRTHYRIKGLRARGV